MLSNDISHYVELHRELALHRRVAPSWKDETAATDGRSSLTSASSPIHASIPEVLEVVAIVVSFSPRASLTWGPTSPCNCYPALWAVSASIRV